MINRINEYVLSNKLFKKPNLKIHELAESLNLPHHKVSQVLNDNLGKSFSAYINTCRVEEAKVLLTSENNFTIEAIGEEAGFSSKTTFYKVFKEQTGLTPKGFLKN